VKTGKPAGTGIELDKEKYGVRFVGAINGKKKRLLDRNPISKSERMDVPYVKYGREREGDRNALNNTETTT